MGQNSMQIYADNGSILDANQHIGASNENR